VRPLRAALLVVGVVVGALVVALSAFVIGVRTKNPATLRFARRMQRDVFNPRALRHAGTQGSPWAVVRHVGRRSGRAYETPVGVAAASDGFFILLPYGAGAQWVQNVRAAGTAVLAVEGREHVVVSPEVVPVVEMPMSDADRLAARIFGIRHALKLHSPDGLDRSEP
jgi:deazaflavin-dependent oxidoreductase (nitroreductase family)